jgi:hypothetical protein
VLGLEYTEGGTFGTRASMIAAMVTLALLPVFIAVARRYGARHIAVPLGIAFAAFLAYSLPATTGRTGEIKEARASVADDVALWKSEHAENAKQLRWAVPDRNAECAGAPDPLPPKGWPNCRRKTGTVTALQERQAKLEAQIKAAGAAGATGDLGSTLWAWALSWFGITAGTIRKGSVLAFAVGLDFAIWSLVALGEHLVALAMRVRRETRATVSEADLWKPGKPWPGPLAQPSVAETLQTSFAHTGLLGNRETQRRNPGDEGNRTDAGNRPRGPRPDNPGNSGPYSGRPFSKLEAERDIVTLLATGATVDEQNDLAQRWSVHKGTVSKWLREWRERDLIPAAQRIGRCHRLVATESSKNSA